MYENLKKEIPYQWKIQSVHGDKASCVAYIDARDAMDLLDSVVGAENWQCDYKEVAGKVYCGVGLRIGKHGDPIETTTWVWKWDAGSESSYEKEKGEASDAFKRACVRWGIGRFLYNLEIKWVKVKLFNNKPHPVDEGGNRIYNLTEYLNNPKPVVKSQAINKPVIDTVVDVFDGDVVPATKDEAFHLISESQKRSGLTNEQVKEIIAKNYVDKTRFADLSLDEAKILVTLVKNHERRKE